MLVAADLADGEMDVTVEMGEQLLNTTTSAS